MSLPESKSEAVSVAIEEMPPGQASSDGKRETFEAIFPGNLPFARLRAWALRGGASIVQQGLFAGSHFLMNVLLARWLAPASYGAFALAYSFFLLALSLYMALLYEPLLVYGAGRYKDVFFAYVRVLLGGHFALLLPLSLLFAFAAPLLGHFYTHELQTAFAWLALVCPFLLLMWLFRAVFYTQLNPYAGTVAGAFYFVLVPTLVWLFHALDILSPATALGIMAIASFLVCAGCLYSIRGAGQAANPRPAGMAARVVSDHWRYGRWAALTAMATWVPANIYYALLPSRYGLEGTATLRAMMNLMYPLLHSFTALLTLLIPILVRQRERESLERSKRTTLQLVAIYVPAGVVYLLLITSLRAPLLNLLYAGRYNSTSTWMVFCVAMLPITTGVIGLLGSALRSFERPHLAFIGYLPSTIVAVFVGVPLSLHYGVSGAATALVLSDLSAIAVLSICFASYKEAKGVAA